MIGQIIKENVKKKKKKKVENLKLALNERKKKTTTKTQVGRSRMSLVVFAAEMTLSPYMKI